MLPPPPQPPESPCGPPGVCVLAPSSHEDPATQGQGHPVTSLDLHQLFKDPSPNRVTLCALGGSGSNTRISGAPSAHPRATSGSCRRDSVAAPCPGHVVRWPRPHTCLCCFRGCPCPQATWKPDPRPFHPPLSLRLCLPSVLLCRACSVHGSRRASRNSGASPQLACAPSRPRAHGGAPFSLSPQCPSERPQRTHTAGAGPPARWPPPASCCAPTATTTSTPTRPTGPPRPPPTAASRRSRCSRRPARPTGAPGLWAAMCPGPAAAPRHSTGSAAPARMARGPCSRGPRGEEGGARGWRGAGLRGDGESGTSHATRLVWDSACGRPGLDSGRVPQG